MQVGLTGAMSFQEALQSALVRNYANFNGRASRSEFWWFTPAILAPSLAARVSDGYLFAGSLTAGDPEAS